MKTAVTQIVSLEMFVQAWGNTNNDRVVGVAWLANGYQPGGTMNALVRLFGVRNRPLRRELELVSPDDYKVSLAKESIAGKLTSDGYLFRPGGDGPELQQSARSALDSAVRDLGWQEIAWPAAYEAPSPNPYYSDFAQESDRAVIWSAYPPDELKYQVGPAPYVDWEAIQARRRGFRCGECGAFFDDPKITVEVLGNAYHPRHIPKAFWAAPPPIWYMVFDQGLWRYEDCNEFVARVMEAGGTFAEARKTLEVLADQRLMFNSAVLTRDDAGVLHIEIQVPDAPPESTERPQMAPPPSPTASRQRRTL